MTEHERAVRAALESPEPWKREFAAMRLQLPFVPDPPPGPGAPHPPPVPAPAPWDAALDALLVERPWESLAWLRRWAVAGRDAAGDVRRYTSPPAADRTGDDSAVVVWLHVAVMGQWLPILKELFSVIERSGLAAVAAEVNVCVVGPKADLSWFPWWARVVKTDGDLAMGENSTLRALWDWSRSRSHHHPDKVLYLHTKGASRGGDARVTAWRDYLVWGCVLRWRECADALDSHDAAGVEFQHAITAAFEALWNAAYDPDRSGFVGNFWWARSDYLASLPADRVILDRDRWNAEWDFVGAGKPRVKCLHDARFNFYNNLCHRSHYDPAARPAKPRIALGVKQAKG